MQPVAISDRIGPGFDCANARRPLALLICADPELSLVDLAYNQAHSALMEDLEPVSRQQLKQEVNEFLDGVVTECKLPREGGLTAEVWRARECVKRQYEGKRAEWINELSGPAREEALRPLPLHIALERKLRQLGFLNAPASPPEGVYGPAARQAISGWQEARGRETTGFLGNQDAMALQSEPLDASPSRPAAPIDPGVPPAGADEVLLQYTNGTYTVPVLVNGMIPLQFVLDSGAADVVLPVDVVLTLIRTGTITDADYIGKEKYRLADGTVIESERFFLHLKVGNHTLERIEASVQKVESRPLLGQSFLSKFDSWTLDNRKHVLVLSAGSALSSHRNGTGQLAPMGKP